jgi:SWI/SNF-related matrix-associated actin-dependent regulator of chromatin subfamily A3
MANRVFIVEPQWNPSVENQAIARALRIGQDKSVLVTRYVVELTVEEVSQRLCLHSNTQLTF